MHQGLAVEEFDIDTFGHFSLDEQAVGHRGFHPAHVEQAKVLRHEPRHHDVQRPGIDEGLGRFVSVRLVRRQMAMPRQHILAGIAQDHRDIQLAHHTSSYATGAAFRVRWRVGGWGGAVVTVAAVSCKPKR